MLTIRKKPTPLETQIHAISEEIRAVTEALAASDSGYNEVDDEYLLEAIIYERSALRARYSYLLKELRRLQSENGDFNA